MDKGFDRYIRHFKPTKPASETLWAEEGLHKEMSWVIFMQQGIHRCLLSGCIHERPKADSRWEALSAWSNFEPFPWHSKNHEEGLFFLEEFVHEFEQAWNHLDNGLPKFRRQAM